MSSPDKESEFSLHHNVQTSFSDPHSLLLDEKQVPSEVNQSERKP